MKKLIDVYIYRIKATVPEFLLLKRATNKIYANQWRMVGGKVEEGEAYWEAAQRELKEETGFNPVSFWVIPSVNTFYEAKTDQIHQIPAFAAEVSLNDEPELDAEHTHFTWVSIGQLDEFLAWPEQKRLIRTATDIIVNNQILPEWIIESE